MRPRSSGTRPLCLGMPNFDENGEWKYAIGSICMGASYCLSAKLLTNLTTVNRIVKMLADSGFNVCIRDN